MRDSPQNWTIFFKSVKVIKDKKRLKDKSRLKKTEKTWQLNPTSDPGPENKHTEKKNGEALKGFTDEILLL